MARYEFQQFTETGTESPFEIPGEIIQTYGKRPYSANFVALVRLPDRGSGPVTFAEDSEGVSYPEPIEEDDERQANWAYDEAAELTCSGETGSGESCTRDVDESGDTCWQH